MARPTVAEIDLGAIRHNLRVLMSLTVAGVECIAVVKADAYGHGALAVSRTLAEEGVTLFAVALTEEAVQLREAGLDGRILIMGYPTADDAEEIVARGFEGVVSSPTQAEGLDETARAMGKRAAVHLKFDTGMGRIGFGPDEAIPAARKIAGLRNLEIVGAMTHFPSADEEKAVAYTRGQIAAFRELKQNLTAAGVRIPLWHAANSAGLLFYPEAHFDAVRPGLSLYGSYPSPEMGRPVELRQALTFKTRIARIRDMPEGATLSYGRTYTTTRPARIATLPVGYADGFSRLLSNRGEVLIRGRRAPVVGRVCMDLTLADVTEVPGASEGDEVVLYGTQQGESISIEEIALMLGTVPQEVMTSVSKRVPRVYRD